MYKFCTQRLNLESPASDVNLSAKKSIVMITPDWVIDSLSSGSLMDPEDYHPDLIKSPPPQPKPIAVRPENTLDTNKTQKIAPATLPTIPSSPSIIPAISTNAFQISHQQQQQGVRVVSKPLTPGVIGTNVKAATGISVQQLLAQTQKPQAGSLPQVLLPQGTALSSPNTIVNQINTVSSRTALLSLRPGGPVSEH
ncbi:unnamed protein product [Protopolystoma xenopodis]|uniref:BRCT domain-containing protein n=1 Tax=Protopolystoma xenopodis TaxID=117903 RepID=A0A3S5AR28_9PLAT|nr:unnamed protein product [Protopolystoma xenopodis]